MIRIHYKGFHHGLQLAVSRVNALFLDHHFYTAIDNHEDFDMCTLKPRILSGIIRNVQLNLNIEFYYALNPFSKAVSYDDDENPQTIWLNKWNLNRSVASLANTLVHQCIHAVNAEYPEHCFGHGSEQDAKDNTAPFWIANLAQRMIQQDDSVCEYMLHEEEQNIPDIARKLHNTNFARPVQYVQYLYS